MRGPVNQPVQLASFADYRRVFGGLWEAGTLSYAVAHFFANGGRQAIIVRVVNGARPATLAILADNFVLTLEARNPGTHELLRASVDYDNSPDVQTDRFNLIVQRVPSADSSLVEDQEIFSKASVLPDSERYIGHLLIQSELVRLVGEVPLKRPDRTVADRSGYPVSYIHSRDDADDGLPLTDYDIIGSATEGTGLFALGEDEDFAMLCVPPLERDRDIGPAVFLAAARFCRRRRAMMIADAPASWRSVAEARAGIRTLNFSSDNVAMYFPRLWLQDPLLGRESEFPACGSVAGVLAALDGRVGIWERPRPVQAAMRSGTRLSLKIAESDSLSLEAMGLNCLRRFPGGIRSVDGFHTMAGAESPKSHWKYLPIRRLTLMILKSLEHGTKWVVFEPNDELLWARVTAQVEEFLEGLFENGAFEGSTPETTFFVKCDTETTRPEDIRRGRVNIIVGFAPTSPGDFLSFVISQRVNETVIRPSDYDPYAVYLT